MNERKPYLIMWNGECGNCPFIARCGFFEIRHPDTGHICPLEIHAKQLTKIHAPNDCHDFNGRFYVEEKI